MIDFDKLKAPFPPEKVSWRVGSTSQDKTKGMALAYLDARDVMDRLDEVCGPAGWQCKYSHANGKTVCDIGIRVQNTTPLTDEDGKSLLGYYEAQWVWKADGAGDTDFEAEKGALSDAFKRAAVRWGIGRYLYDCKSPWVQIDQYKKIAAHEYERLMASLPNALPGGVKQLAPTGLSKEPAKFWSNAKLVISLPVSKFPNPEWNEEAWDYWKDMFSEAINKAPSSALLDKLFIDNDHILTKMPAVELEGYRLAGEIRKEQLKEYGL